MNRRSLAKADQGFADIVSANGDFRYKVGVIDFLTRYTSAKYVENKVKSIASRVESASISAIHQDQYKERFDYFLQ